MLNRHNSDDDRIIGSYMEHPIFDLIVVDGQQFVFAGIARPLLDTAELPEGEHVVGPGLIYAQAFSVGPGGGAGRMLSFTRVDEKQADGSAAKRLSVSAALLRLVNSYIWHFYRIATQRPAFRCASDSAGVLCTFVLIFLLSEVSRFLLQDTDFASLALRFCGHAALIVFFTLKRNQSRVLMAFWFGAAAIANAAALLAFGAAGSLSTAAQGICYLYQTAMMICSIRAFHFGRSCVRKRGYMGQGASR